MRLGTKIFTLPAGLFAAAMLIAASPVSAQTEATSAQISGKLPDLVQGANSPLGKGDEEFSQLFASWKALDNGNWSTSPGRISVSVPSMMPTDAVRISSLFGMREHPTLHRYKAHKGIDLAAPRGTPVYATADGIVGKAQRYGTYGNYVQIEHGGEIETRYAHLSGFVVTPGESVHKGELIGYVGSTGRSTGPHLHYEVRIDGKAVDPMPFLLGEEGQIQLATSEDKSAMGGGDDGDDAAE